MVKRSWQDSASSVDEDYAVNISSNTPEDDILAPREPRERSNQAEKYAHLDTLTTPAKEIMRCDLPPHKPLSFQSFDDYEIHYRQTHTNRCHECGRNLPTEHFLSLHIAENHDPITAAKREKGMKTYSCFVEGCDKVCIDSRKRRMHLVDKHMFPSNYDFFVVNDGMDNRNSMLRLEPGYRRRSSAASRAALVRRRSSNQERLEATKAVAGLEEVRGDPSKDSDPVMDDVTAAMSSLKFVPNSVRFGRRNRRGGLAAS